MTDSIALYQRSKDFLWTDKHISGQMLALHLDTTNDAASRNARTIDATVDWVDSVIHRDASILDLGCGPGLYAERLSLKGHAVTGIDISRSSIRYAKESARKKCLPIRYYRQSYLRSVSLGAFDVALCIYCDFGALTPGEQATFLRNASRNLRDDGILILDVFSDDLGATRTEERKWEYCDTGDFWSTKPHYILHECKYFGDAHAWGTRDVIIEPRKTREFITWDTTYTGDSVSALLRENGFAVEAIRTDLVRKNEFTSDDVLFVKARKLNREKGAS